MKKLSLFITACIVCCMAAFADPITVKLYPDSTFEGDETPEIYIYPAAKPNGQAIVCCPGGSYAMRASEHEGHNFAKWLNDQGITLAVLQYRLPHGRTLVPGNDARQAIRVLRQNAKKYGITSVGIMGFSAGGHLASTVSTHYDATSRPDFSILFYPVITMDKSYTHMGTHDNLLGANPTPGDEHQYSNEFQVTHDTPPAIILHSGDDDVVPVRNAVEYYNALITNGVQPSSLHIYPTGGHGWGFGDGFKYKPEWQHELSTWLKTLRGE